MSIPRFYCAPPIQAGSELELPVAAAHHASRVLRLRVNDAVQVFDGTGIELTGSIREISNKRVMLEKLQASTVNRESPLHIVLAQALCSSEKMDWVVQKATELGVTEIQPVQTQRSVAKLANERAEKRVDHWRSVIIAACEQCGRNVLPLIHPPQGLQDWLGMTRTRPGQKFMLLPQAASTLSSFHPVPKQTITLLIGPEGGFTAEEEGLAQHIGFFPIRLGARVLRTETAAVAGITALQALWGDFQ